MRQNIPHKDQKTMILLLILCVLMVIIMVILGGMTRLRGAGLSIVKWQPLSILPPLNQEAWLQEFALYQKFPEYQKITSHISLKEFKTIFWIEYSHRLWGRFIGLVLIVPTLLCFTKKHLKPLLFPLISVWLLGGLQAAMGWYMVKSGLLEQPWVSPYRLTFHLVLAFGILAVLLWMIFSLLPLRRKANNFRYRSLVFLSLGFIIMTIVMGGFTAGLKAGYLYNTFPTMDGQWLPSDLLFLNPFWRNFFENPTTAQFCHRWLAILSWGSSAWLVYHALQKTTDPYIRLSTFILGGLLTFQGVLGISTLVLQVPPLLALTHQLTALFVFGVAWWLLYLTYSQDSSHDLSVAQIHPPPKSRLS